MLFTFVCLLCSHNYSINLSGLFCSKTFNGQKQLQFQLIILLKTKYNMQQFYVLFYTISKSISVLESY